MDINVAGILLIFFLVLVNAFFAASEIAVITSRRVKIEKLREGGNKSAQTLVRLIEDPSLFLATIQVGITLAGFLASATAAVGLSAVVAGSFRGFGLSQGLSNSLGIFVVTVTISYITLIFGELAPKRLAMQWSEKVALIVAGPIDLIAKATTPVTRFLTFSTNIVVRLVGGNPRQLEREITEDEIRLYIAEHRTLPEEEKRMIDAVFDFGDQVVRQIMVPRTEIFYVNAEDHIKEALEKVCNVDHSSFPVFKGDYENIVGTVRIHSLVCSFLSNPSDRVEMAMAPPLFVPETKDTVELLKEFREKKVGMAVVVDEYGGIAGLITLEDLIDEIIGDVVDKQNNIFKTADGYWIVEGDTPIQDVIDTLDLKNIRPDAEYETLAGFLLERFGRLPAEGDTLSWEGYVFRIIQMGVRRITKVSIGHEAGDSYH